MKKSLRVFLWILALCLIWHAESHSKSISFKIKIAASGANASQVFSYVARELRSLGDVEVVDKSYNYSIDILTVTTETMSGHRVGGYATAFVILDKDNVFLYCYLYMFDKDDFKGTCETVLTNFDIQFLEPIRQQLRKE